MQNWTDSVILATGYQAGLTDFIKHIEPELTTEDSLKSLFLTSEVFILLDLMITALGGFRV
ncbi:MAG: hypothetical protein R3B47_16290 [Bacteroidia bacterium]